MIQLQLSFFLFSIVLCIEEISLEEVDIKPIKRDRRVRGHKIRRSK